MTTFKKTVLMLLLNNIFADGGLRKINFNIRAGLAAVVI
jgi:hypothetical protein